LIVIGAVFEKLKVVAIARCAAAS